MQSEASKSGLDGNIDEMAEVQREKRVKAVDRGGCDVGSVTVGLGRKQTSIEDTLGKDEHRVGNFEQRQRCEQGKPGAGEFRVTRASFVEHDLGGEKLVRLPIA